MGSKLMRVSRDLGDDLDYGGACVLAGFSLLPFSCIIAASLLS